MVLEIMTIAAGALGLISIGLRIYQWRRGGDGWAPLPDGVSDDARMAYANKLEAEFMAICGEKQIECGELRRVREISKQLKTTGLKSYTDEKGRVYTR